MVFMVKKVNIYKIGKENWLKDSMENTSYISWSAIMLRFLQVKKYNERNCVAVLEKYQYVPNIAAKNNCT